MTSRSANQLAMDLSDAVHRATGAATYVDSEARGGPVVWVTLGNRRFRLARVRSDGIHVRPAWMQPVRPADAVDLTVSALRDLAEELKDDTQSAEAPQQRSWHWIQPSRSDLRASERERGHSGSD